MVVMEGITVAKIPVANPAVVSRDGLDEGKVMVNCDTGATIALNKTGALVWTLIDGRRNPEEIAEAVSRNFSDAPDTVKNDVAAFLVTLSEEGFLGYEIKSQTNNF
ncbi:MAG: PqqD family protein [Methanoregula sp.]|nr:PqqD family protein [Methanoregula sp.]